jgi:hypothetical protein
MGIEAAIFAPGGELQGLLTRTDIDRLTSI